jgi:hypothetical protein
MNPNTATDILLRLRGISTCPKAVREEVVAFIGIIAARPEPIKAEPKVKEQPNEIKEEENTIDLQTIDHFDMPEEMNIQIEGNEQ